ncbi:TetR family transcriptional regulator [Nocardioides sp. WV_118_6]|uniref:TetR/AcrR family transcriptional regulator n=1 Tax=Nocardioides simplex TaxID=2045 RepID=UPI00214F781D|nr:TetR family transcriptional regulator [Pimelobacter simplex]UUW92144.1 TetR family transcriptional regulator [Pimelobacter simplex]UUW95970.1 TetR family transcriptional regulator [Pimelobacter simplex]
MATAPRPTARARSAQRQQAMVDAAARLLIEEGPDAVTHRKVAAAAGVPAGSAGYYFPTRQELYAAAVAAAEQVRSAGAAERAAALPRRRRSATATAALLLEVLYAPALDRAVVTRRLQPMLEATSDPELRPIMAASRPALLDALRETLDRCGWGAVGASADFDLVVRMLDAALLYGAAAGDEDPVADAVADVARLLELVSRS